MGKALRQVFGDDGVSMLRKQNWTLTGFLLIALGVISDLMQIFGRITDIGLIFSGLAAAAFGFVVLRRLKWRRACVVPFVSSSIFVAMFAGIAVAQRSANASDTGLLATAFPEASAIQQAIYARLTSIDDRTKTIDRKLDILIADYQQANPDVDPSTVEAFRAAAENLAASGDARKRKALADFAGGHQDQAITDLTRVAEDQSKVASNNAQQAAETWKEVGALAFLTDTPKALSAYLKAVDLSADDPVARNQLAHLYRRVGELEKAATHYQFLLANTGDLDQSWKAASLGNLGLIERTRGNFDLAASYHKRSLAINQEIGHKEGMAGTLGNLGALEQSRGNLELAESYHKRSLAIKEELGRKESMAGTLDNLGALEHTRGNLDSAESYHNRSLAIDEEIGRKEGMAASLGNLGAIELTRGNLDSAESYQKRSLAINEEIGSNEGMTTSLGNLGAIEWNRGNLDGSEEYFKRSLAMLRELGDKPGVAHELASLGLIDRRRGNLAAACEKWRASYALFAESGVAPKQSIVQSWIDDECL